jgi:O-antigen ligase
MPVATVRHLPSLRLTVAIALSLILILAGGASRADEDQQAVVRLAAILAIAVSLWSLDTGPLRPHRAPLYAGGAVLLLMLLHLVPLPFAVWRLLPGHAPYASIAAATALVGWRPLSLTPDLTVDAVFALLPPLAAGLAVLLLQRRLRAWLWFVLAAGALGSAALGIIQSQIGGTSYHLFRMTNPDTAVGVFANRNHQAAYLAAMLPLTGALASWFVRKGSDTRLVLSGVAAVDAALLLALVLTGSRMALVLAAFGIVGALWPIVRGGSRRLWIGAVAAGGGAVAFIAVALAMTRDSALERFTIASFNDETRRAAFGPLLATARAFLPMGAGFGAFDTVYRRFEPTNQLSTIYLNAAHNEPLQLAIEGGVPALVLLALFGWWWVGSAKRILIAHRASFAAAAVWTTVILIASSMVDYPLHTPLLGAVFVMSCAEMWLWKREA